MKIVVMSDSHGALDRLSEVFERCYDADLYLFLGDGERDIEKMQLKYPHKDIRAVKGNCDYNSLLPSVMIADLPYHGESIKILFTHGHMHNVHYGTEMLRRTAQMSGAAVALYGHTHQRYMNFEDNIYVMNPGSVGLPRDGKGPSFGVIEILPEGILMNIADI